MSCLEIFNGGQSGQYPFFSLRFFKAGHVSFIQHMGFSSRTWPWETRKYSNYSSRFVFNALTLDHSVPQTWFSPNPLSGNANVFFLSFWWSMKCMAGRAGLEVISLMLTELRKYSLSYIHPNYPSLPPAAQLQIEAIAMRQERRQQWQVMPEKGRQGESMKTREKLGR